MHNEISFRVPEPPKKNLPPQLAAEAEMAYGGPAKTEPVPNDSEVLGIPVVSGTPAATAETPVVTPANMAETPQPQPEKTIIPPVVAEQISATKDIPNLPKKELSFLGRLIQGAWLSSKQSGLDKHEGKALELKTEISGLDLKVNAFDNAKSEVQKTIDYFRNNNLPGAESLQLNLKQIDKDKMKVLNKKADVESKYEAEDNKRKIYANERDAVADKLIGHYEQKLAPLERELENLNNFRDQVDLTIVVAEARHREVLTRLEGMEKAKSQMEAAFRTSGASERKIKNNGALKTIEKFLVDGRESIRKENECLAKRRATIDKQIAEADEKANPFRDKRDKIARIKVRPMNMDVPTRTRVQVGSGDKEEVLSHSRADEVPTGEPVEDVSGEVVKESAESAEKKDERPKMSEVISEWNKYLSQKPRKGEVANVVVDQPDFFASMRARGLKEDSKLDVKNLKNILEKYYKVKKMSVDKLNKDFDKFFKNKFKTNK